MTLRRVSSPWKPDRAIAAGLTAQCPYPSKQAINSAELADPSTQAWTNTKNLHDSRSGESITVLPNGKALLAGGGQHTKNKSGFVILSSAELYTPLGHDGREGCESRIVAAASPLFQIGFVLVRLLQPWQPRKHYSSNFFALIATPRVSAANRHA
jgi:hypothetical protein